MNKYLALLLVSAVLLGGCRKEPKTIPETTEQEADPVMFARKNASGDLLFTRKCKDGHILGLALDGNYNASLRKISATDGTTIWDMPIEPMSGYLSDIEEMPDGSIWLSENDFSSGTVVSAFSSTGTALWKKTYPIRMNGPKILSLKDGETIILGSGAGKLVAISIATNGDTLFTRSKSITALFEIADALVTITGNIIAVGNDSYNSHLKFVMLDQDLEILSERTIAEQGIDREVHKCVESENGDILCAGQQPPYPSYKDAFVMRLSSSLEKIQTDVFSNDTLAINLHDIAATKNGYVIAGTARNKGEYAYIATSEAAGYKRQEKFFPRASGNVKEYFNGVHRNGSGYLLVGTGYTNFVYNHFIVTLDKNLDGSW